MRPILMLSLLFQIACSVGTAGPTKPASVEANEFSHIARMDCSIDENPFKCQKIACTNAGGTYSDLDKSCSCPMGALFDARAGGECLSPQINQKTGNVAYRNADGKRSLVLPNNIPQDQKNPISTSQDQSNNSLIRFVQTMSLPISLSARNILRIYAGAEEFRKLNSMDPAFNPEPNFLRPNSDLEVNGNKGVLDAMADIQTWSVFAPRDLPIQIPDENLTQLANRTMEVINSKGFSPSKTFSFSKLGCAEICDSIQDLGEYQNYSITRVRNYSGGNPVSDLLKFLNKDTGTFDLVIRLVGNQISHYQYKTPKDYTTVTNDGSLVSQSDIHLKIESQRLAPNSKKEQIPVLIFEAPITDSVDKFVTVGPYVDASYYGWFAKEDQVPYLSGKTSLDFGLDLQSNFVHSNNVTSIASDNFKKSIIPFDQSGLLYGYFLKAYRHLPFTKMVGSISFGSSYADQMAHQNEMASVLKSTAEKILWVVGAGNTGGEMPHSIAQLVPQNQGELGNVLVVASSGDNERIASTSTYSEKMVHIAAKGCAANQTSCEDKDSATSYAAPKVARGVADLFKQQPDISPEQMKWIVMASARVPSYRSWGRTTNEFNATKSGGFFDLGASIKLIDSLTATQQLDIRQIEQSKLVDLVSDAKAEQYADQSLTRNQLKSLVSDQIKRIFKN